MDRLSLITPLNEDTSACGLYTDFSCTVTQFNFVHCLYSFGFFAVPREVRAVLLQESRLSVRPSVRPSVTLVDCNL